MSACYICKVNNDSHKQNVAYSYLSLTQCMIYLFIGMRVVENIINTISLSQNRTKCKGVSNSP